MKQSLNVCISLSGCLSKYECLSFRISISLLIYMSPSQVLRPRHLLGWASKRLQENGGETNGPRLLQRLPKASLKVSVVLRQGGEGLLRCELCRLG